MKRNLIFILSVFFFSFFISSSSFALKHEIQKIPLYTYAYRTSNDIERIFTSSNTVANNFTWGWNSTNFPSDFDNSKTSASRFFGAKVYSSSCAYNSNFNPSSSGNLSVSSTSYFIATPLVYGSDSHFNSSSNSICNQLSSFGSDGVPSFTVNDLPSSQYEFVNSLLPYHFDYSALSVNDSGYINDVYYNAPGSLMFHDIFGWDNMKYMNKPDRFGFPIGVIHDIQSDDFVDITSGTSLEFHFSLYFGEVDHSYNHDLSGFSNFNLVWFGYPDIENGNSVSGISSCSYSSDNSDGYGIMVDVTCPWTSSYSFSDNFIWFGIAAHSSDYLWDIKQVEDDNYFDISIYKNSLYVISDYNSTLGGSMGATLVGSNLEIAPGSIQNQFGSSGSTDDADWLATFKNLFNFTLFNPFTPIFALFTDNSSCVNIPIIAGMLNSSNTTYCPWFPSSVRNIVTPVLGIASLMLAFGFIVRWLKSSDEGLIQTSKKGVD